MWDLNLDNHLKGTDSKIAKCVAKALSGYTFHQPTSSESLSSLCESLRASLNEKKLADRRIQRLVDLIEEEKSIEICRYFIGGSLGTRTSMGAPTATLIVYIHLTDNEKEIFKNSDYAELVKANLDMIEKCLRLSKKVPCAEELNFKVEDFQNTSVIVDFQDAVFNIYVVPQFSWNSGAQYREVVSISEKFSENNDGLEIWAPAYFEIYSKCLAREPEVLRSTIRLCCYWSYIHKLKMPVSLIEKLVIAVYRKLLLLLAKINLNKVKAEKASPSLLMAFAFFIYCLSDLNVLTQLSNTPDRKEEAEKHSLYISEVNQNENALSETTLAELSAAAEVANWTHLKLCGANYNVQPLIENLRLGEDEKMLASWSVLPASLKIDLQTLFSPLFYKPAEPMSLVHTVSFAAFLLLGSFILLYILRCCYTRDKNHTTVFEETDQNHSEF